MAEVTELALLSAWETAAGGPAADRALALATVVSDLPLEDVADLTLGDCDLLLLRLREQCFGPRLDGLAECPRCTAQLDVAIDVDELRVRPAGEAATADRHRTVEAGGTLLRLRPLTGRDVRSCGPDRARLLARCAAGAPPDPGPDLLAVIEANLDLLDPQAALVLGLDCPECGATWQTPVDVTDFVWHEVDCFARRVLYDVHTLARAYGWTEPDVLAVSPARRRFYLDACAS